MAEDYLATEAREKRDQLIRDAQWRRLNNFLSNGTPTGNKSSDSLLNIVTGYLNGSNGTPSYSSTAPTTNGGQFPWFSNQYQNNGNNGTNGTYQPFSVADTLAQRAKGYQAQGLEGLANSYKTLNRENNIYNNTANKITDYYTALANDINSRENALAQRKESLANQLSQDIANQRQYVMDYFGPNGIFTNEVNRYYDENGNYLASEAGRQMAMANAEGIQSGASLGAQRAARNEAYNNAFQNYLKVKEQELTAKMSIQTQLINYMKALREEYGNTQNQFIISQYERANDLLNAISTNLAQTQANITTARLQQSTAGNNSNRSLLENAIAGNQAIVQQYGNKSSEWPEDVKNAYLANEYVIQQFAGVYTPNTTNENNTETTTPGTSVEGGK